MALHLVLAKQFVARQESSYSELHSSNCCTGFSNLQGGSTIYWFFFEAANIKNSLIPYKFWPLQNKCWCWIASSTGTTGIGVVIRDAGGSFVVGIALRHEGCTNPLRAEFSATRASLLFAWELRLRQVHLESDAKQVFDRIISSKEDLSYNGSTLADILMYST